MNNVTLTAMLVAILAAAYGVSSLLRRWHNRLFQAFASLCAAAFLANIGTVMAGLDSARIWHVMHLLGAIASAPTAVYFFLRLLGKPQPRGASLRALLMPIALALSLVVVLSYDPLSRPAQVDLTWLLELSSLPWSSTAPTAQPGVVAIEDRLRALLEQLLSHPSSLLVPLMVGIYVFSTHFLIWLNVLDRRRRSRSGVERARLNLLALLGAFLIVGNVIQALSPYVDLPVTGYPFGGLAQLVLLFFLSQVILLYRLLDLHETLSKALIFGAQVLIIGGVYSLLLAVFGDRKSWVNLAITIFLASGVASLIHAPLKRIIERTIHRLFFAKRYELIVRLNQLERELPRILSVDDLFDAFVTGLTEVPRITHAAIFLWDERTKRYHCERRNGPEGWPPDAVITASSALAQELLTRKKPFGREDLQREVEGLEAQRIEVGAALDTLRKLEGEVAIGFTGEGLLYGFLILTDDATREGFTHDELDLLQQLADKASVIIQNSDAIQELKERDRLAALGQMAAGLAHEIRNPLGAIKGAAEYLAEDAPDQLDREFLDIIRVEVDRLNKVVTDFLDYSRPLKTRIEPFSLNKLVQQSVAVQQASGIPDTITLKIELDQDLPPVPVDVEKMKQVFLNLMRNAIQAMPQGGTLTVQTRRAPRVSWAGTRRGEATLERLEVRVVDTGEGIAPEHLEKLFIPFFTTKAGGTGLGLAISQRLVRALEGEMEVESVPGQGSRFTVRLPVFQSKAGQEAPTPLEPAAQAPEPDAA